MTDSSDIILEVQHVTKQFPGVKALTDVSLSVKKGSIHGLCGENGAGKSTLMKILAGVYPFGSYEGKVLLDGRELRFGSDSIREATKAGIAIVHQELALVPLMTVGENMFLGREPTRFGTVDWNRLYRDTQRILDEFRLEIPAGAVVSSLGVGLQQIVEIAKALSEDAKVLILDEPTSALTDAEVDVLMNILGDLKRRGVTCILISHRMEEFFRITDHVSVMRDGHVVGTFETKDCSYDMLISLMVGRDMSERFPARSRSLGDVVLKVSGLTVENPARSRIRALRDVSFELRRGEILGIAGLMGSGRSELLGALFGEYGAELRGEVVLDGKQIRVSSAREAMGFKIALVPEDRKHQGLVLNQSILNNISLPNLDQFGGFLSLNRHAELRECEKFSKSLGVKAPSVLSLVNALSGGNQQKVVIAKWLMSDPRVLMLDEPTRGVDVGAKFEIYKLINRLAEEGVAILLVSSELPEVLGMSDRILVMHEGRSAGVIDAKEASQEKIMQMATGFGSRTAGQVQAQ